VEHFWWGSIFLVNVPVAIAAVIGALLFVPTSRDPATPPVDVVGLLLSAVGLILLVYTIIEAPTVGWGAGRSVTGFASSALILLMFGWWESRSTHPMLDLSVFRNRRFAGSSLAVTAAYVGIFGFIFLTTQYFQFLKDYTAFGTGARMLPVAVALAVSGVVAPRLVEWVGTTSVVVFGLLMLAAGMAGGALFAVSTPYPQIAIVMVLIGGGMGFTSAPATEAIMGSLSADKAGVGSAVNESSRELGAALGVAVVGSVFASIYTARLADYTAITSLPTAGRSKIGESIAAAQRVIGQLPSTQSANVKLAVDDAFLDGMGTGSLVCAAIALAAAAIVAVLLPAHAGADDRELTADMPGVSQKHVPDNSSR
jgi:predicted MFS family arabinose efflux permease